MDLRNVLHETLTELARPKIQVWLGEVFDQLGMIDSPEDRTH